MYAIRSYYEQAGTLAIRVNNDSGLHLVSGKLHLIEERGASSQIVSAAATAGSGPARNNFV